MVELLIRCYFRSCEVTHRLFHPLQFRDELHNLWDNTDGVSDAWLAQLCMMLALGCRVAPISYLQDNTGKSGRDWTSILLDAAQSSFGRSPYMLSPSLTTVRTLCMVVMAGMLELIGDSSPEYSLVLMGLVTRIATTLQLHRSTALLPAMSALEAEARRRVWVTVRLLDLDLAMRSGTSFISHDHDADPPLNINEIDLTRSALGIWSMETPEAAPHEYTDGTLQAKLAAGFLPLLIEVVDAVNSPTRPAVDCETALAWDAAIRKRMSDADSVFALEGSPKNRRPDRVHRATAQHQFLHVLAHRALLALNHHILDPLRSVGGPGGKVLTESALALLRIQDSWTGANVKEEEAWLADICHDDFDSAILYAIIALRRSKHRGGDWCPGDMNSAEAQEAWAALGRAVEAVREVACRSLAHFKVFVGVSILVGCLENLGRELETQLETMHCVADQIERAVLSGGQSLPGAGEDTGARPMFWGGVISGDSMMDFDAELLDSFVALPTLVADD